MVEENKVQQVTTKEPQQVTTKEPQQVQRETTKNPKKVEVGKRLAAHNRRKREEKKREELKAQAQKSELNQYYDIGAVIAVGVIGGLGYYVYQAKKGDIPNNPPPQQPRPQSNKFEMD